MKKILVIIFGSIILGVGLIALFIGIYKKQYKVEYKTNTIELSSEFENIKVNIAETDFEIKYSETNKIVFYEKEKIEHEAKVADNELVIKANDNRRWFEKWFFNGFESMKATLYLNFNNLNNIVVNMSTGDLVINKEFNVNKLSFSGSTGDVKLYSKISELSAETSTGDFKLSDANFDSINILLSTGDIELNNINVINDINISSSTGDVKLNKVTGKNLSISTSTGDVKFDETTIENKITAKTSTGDVEFNNSDSLTLYIETTTGDIAGSLKTSKTFYVKTSGDIDTPRTNGGDCDIVSSTGDVKIEIK